MSPEVPSSSEMPPRPNRRSGRSLLISLFLASAYLASACDEGTFGALTGDYFQPTSAWYVAGDPNRSFIFQSSEDGQSDGGFTGVEVVRDARQTLAAARLTDIAVPAGVAQDSVVFSLAGAWVENDITFTVQRPIPVTYTGVFNENDPESLVISSAVETLRLVKITAAAVRVTGSVTVTGEGIPNVTVTLTGSGLRSTITDGSGFFAFDEVEGGLSTLSISDFPPQFAFQPTTADIFVQVDGPPIDIHFVGSIAQSAAIVGQVSFPTGGPGPLGTPVQLEGPSSDETVTGPGGEFVFTGLTSGEYELSTPNDRVSVVLEVGETEVVGLIAFPPPPPADLRRWEVSRPSDDVNVCNAATCTVGDSSVLLVADAVGPAATFSNPWMTVRFYYLDPVSGRVQPISGTPQVQVTDNGERTWSWALMWTPLGVAPGRAPVFAVGTGPNQAYLATQLVPWIEIVN